MNMMQQRGLRINACGILLVILHRPEDFPFATIYCLRSDKEHLNQCCNLPPSPFNTISWDLRIWKQHIKVVVSFSGPQALLFADLALAIRPDAGRQLYLDHGMAGLRASDEPRASLH